MCGIAYESYLEYAAVFPEIADLLNACGVKAEVKEYHSGLIVEVLAGTLSDGERDNWSVDLGDNIIELGIPVQNRNAMAITRALLKAIGEIRG